MLSEADVRRVVADLVSEYTRTEITKESVWCPIAIDSWNEIMSIAQAYNSEQDHQTRSQIELSERRSNLSLTRRKNRTEIYDHDMDGETEFSAAASQWSGPIDNSSLCEHGKTTMSRELSRSSYELVPECVFNKLVELFKIVPSSARNCSSFRCRTRLNPDKQYEIEVTLTPINFFWGFDDKVGRKGRFSRFDTLTQIYERLVKSAGVEDNNVENSHTRNNSSNNMPLPSIGEFKIYRLTDYRGQDWIELSKDKPLVVIGLGPNSTICFDFDRSLEMRLLEASRPLVSGKDSTNLTYSNKKRFNSASDDKQSSSGSSTSNSSKEGDGAIIRGLCGLVNLGNTCFMNSSIQCLSNVPHMREYFERGAYRLDLEAGSKMAPSTSSSSSFRSNSRGLVANAFSNLMKEMWKPGVNCCDPSALKYAISRISNKFSGYSQQDSQELMGVLLDALHEDVKRQWNDSDSENEDEKSELAVPRSGKQRANLIRQRLEQMSQDIKLPDNEIAQLALNLHRCQGESYVMRLFQGLVKSTVQCLNCYHYSRTFDPFMFLCLPISEEAQSNGFSSSKRLNFKQSSVTQRKPAISSNTKAIFCPLITINGLIRTVVVCLDRTTFGSETAGHRAGRPEPSVDMLLKTAEESCVFVDTGGVHPVPRLHLVTDENEKSDHFSIVDRNKLLANFLHNRCREDSDCNLSSDSINLSENRFAEYVLRRGIFLCQCPPVTYADEDPVLITIAIGRLRIFPLFVSFAALKRSLECQKGASSDHGGPTSISILANQTLKSLDFDVRLNQVSLEQTNRNGAAGNDATVSTVRSYVAKCKLSACPREYSGQNDISDCSQLVNDKKLFRKRFRQVVRNGLVHAKLPHLGNSHHSVTLNQCLSLFTETELLDEEDMWYCSECKRKSISTKRMDIFQLPPYLLIQLKRFRQMFYGRQKIETQVEFPVDRLDLKNFLPRTLQQQQSCIYDLVAVSNHFGNLHAGHYTASARNCMDNKWHIFDDRRVSKVKDIDELVSSHAYILVYKCKDRVL